jgi:hypothetical protein
MDFAGFKELLPAEVSSAFTKKSEPSTGVKMESEEKEEKEKMDSGKYLKDSGKYAIVLPSAPSY